MKEVLVVANRTLGGAKLLQAVRERAAAGDVRFRLIVPQSDPTAGLVIYDEAVRESAQARVDLALSLVAGESIDATGEVGDADPFLATMDAIATRRPDEILISTHPAISSGWLRRDLVERIRNASGLPVEHVVVDIEQEGLPFKVTLVLASKTLGGDELLQRLTEKASSGERRLFIVIVPQPDGSGGAPKLARARLATMLDRLHSAGLVGSGMIGDPDPYTAAVNALELFRVDDVVISTLPDERSGWMRSNLIERVQHMTSAPVEHVVVDLQPTSTAASAA
ncbi:MAG: hypothetical protein QOC91_348 [Solirubrobacteraceae bacterium]|jgi:hypothetical protein|nr:hypothetical protein [Solirubrobacteraceae bacterium]MEA2335137.1 hypothetical protein [Solirubrobacteraceae bacterium]